MTQLSDLYDGDLSLRRSDVIRLRPMVRAPHPMHGVRYADGLILCGRPSCQPCREYRKTQRKASS